MNLYDKILSLTNMKGCATFTDHICSMRKDYAIRTPLSGEVQRIDPMSGTANVLTFISGEIQKIDSISGVVQKINNLGGEVTMQPIIEGATKCQK